MSDFFFFLNEKVMESFYELLQLNVDYVSVKAAKWLVLMTGKIKIPSRCESALISVPLD